MGKAIGYSLKNWQALTRFITNVEIPLDDNRSERSQESLLLGAKIFCSPATRKLEKISRRSTESSRPASTGRPQMRQPEHGWSKDGTEHVLWKSQVFHAALLFVEATK